MIHPTMTLTLLLVSEGMQHKYTNRFDDAVHEVLERLFTNWSDEKKADLYARLAERVTHDMPIAQMERAVDDCLCDNAAEFPHG